MRAKRGRVSRILAVILILSSGAWMAACGDDNPPPLSPTTEENDNFYEDLQAARKAKWAAQEADCDERGGVWVETYVYPGEIDRAVCTGPGVTVEFSEEND